MARRNSIQIDGIRTTKKDNVFLMDIYATLEGPEHVQKFNFYNVELCTDDVLKVEKLDLPILVPRTNTSANGYIKLSDGIPRRFTGANVEIIEKHRPEISIEEAEKLLKCKIVRK